MCLTGIFIYKQFSLEGEMKCIVLIHNVAHCPFQELDQTQHSNCLSYTLCYLQGSKSHTGRSPGSSVNNINKVFKFILFLFLTIPPFDGQENQITVNFECSTILYLCIQS